MKTKIMLAVGLMLVLAVAIGYGQPSRLLKAKIPFQFTVDNKPLPAGDYEFSYDVASDTFRVKGEGQDGFLVKTVTRIAGDIHTTAKDAHITFDKAGDIYMLSELWFPAEDGYLVRPTPEKHTHAVVSVTYTVSPEPVPEKPY